MSVIASSGDSLKQLDLSHNALAAELSNKAAISFIEQTVAFMDASVSLQHLNLSSVNLRSRVLQIMWPAARSRSLIAIHLDNNEIPSAQLPYVFAAFGIKTSAGDLFD